MEKITLALPWPPSVNNYKRVGRLVKTKNGKTLQYRVNSDETKLFYWKVLQIHRRECSKSFSDGTIYLKVYIDLHPPNKRRSDGDNRVKLIFDSLQRAGIIVNDYQIACHTVTRKHIIPGGKVIVRIKQYEPRTKSKERRSTS